MPSTDKKLPSKEGLKRAREQLKKISKKSPSDDLVKIISKIGKETDAEKPGSADDIAARSGSSKGADI